MKPRLVEVLEIALMKKRATDLYDEIDARVAALYEEFGANRFDYDLKDLRSDGAYPEAAEFGKELLEEKQYFKFEIIDNLKTMVEEGVVWKSTSFKPVSFASGALKNAPKSLK